MGSASRCASATDDDAQQLGLNRSCLAFVIGIARQGARGPSLGRDDYAFGVVVSAAFFGTVVSAVFFGVVVSAVFLPATVVSAAFFGFGARAHFKLLPVFLQTNADPLVVLALPPTFVHLVPTFAVAVLALPGAAKATSARGAIAKSASCFFMPITVSRSAMTQPYLRLQHVQVLTATSAQPQKGHAKGGGQSDAEVDSASAATIG
jgi:hypothetical protein